MPLQCHQHRLSRLFRYILHLCEIFLKKVQEQESVALHFAPIVFSHLGLSAEAAAGALILPDVVRPSAASPAEDHVLLAGLAAHCMCSLGHGMLLESPSL